MARVRSTSRRGPTVPQRGSRPVLSELLRRRGRVVVPRVVVVVGLGLLGWYWSATTSTTRRTGSWPTSRTPTSASPIASVVRRQRAGVTTAVGALFQRTAPRGADCHCRRLQAVLRCREHPKRKHPKLGRQRGTA